MSREEQIRQVASFSNMISNDFIRGAKWSDEHPRKGLWDKEKVCEYIKEYAPIDYDCDGFIEDLIKAMEE